MCLLTQRVLKEENATKLYNSGKPDSLDVIFFLNKYPTQSHHSIINFLSHPSQPFRVRGVKSRGRNSKGLKFRGLGRERANNQYSRERNYCGGLNHLNKNCRNRIRDERER